MRDRSQGMSAGQCARAFSEWLCRWSSFLVFAACSQGQPDAKDLQLAGGALVPDIRVHDGPIVLLLADPDDCLSCDQDLLTMLKVRREYPGRVQLVLTRSPSQSERKQLALGGHTADAILESGEAQKVKVDLPAVAVIRAEDPSPIRSLAGTVQELRELLRSSNPAVILTP